MEAGAVSRSTPVGVPRGLSPGFLRLASDSRLVALTREGRVAAFEVAYDRHYRSILSFCRHMLGDLEEAQDAVQQTFLSAYNALLGSDKPIHLRAWLFTIARNRCYSILRARREQPTGDLSDALTEGLAAQVQRRQDLRDLVVDMQQLPHEQRAALVLAELDSLSHEEIAEVLEVPTGKVKALVYQAREALIASRTARETDCRDIREQLATSRGASLRRGNLRRHLRQCQGCRDFRKQVERQRRQIAVLLPMAPGIAAKELIFASTVAGGAAAGAVSGGGVLASSAFKGGLVKVLVGSAAAGIGTVSTLAVTGGIHKPSPAKNQVAAVGRPASGQHPTAARHETTHARARTGGAGLSAGATSTGPSGVKAHLQTTIPATFVSLAFHRARSLRLHGAQPRKALAVRRIRARKPGVLTQTAIAAEVRSRHLARPSAQGAAAGHRRPDGKRARARHDWRVLRRWRTAIRRARGAWPRHHARHGRHARAEGDARGAAAVRSAPQVRLGQSHHGRRAP
jgi:RNA polymerase sigma factor (sigma-70 family)